MDISIRHQPANALFATAHRYPTAIGLVGRLAIWIQRSRGRQALRELDERLLQDIGVSDADASREAAKRFWTA